MAATYLGGVAVLTMTPQHTWDRPMGVVRGAIAELHDHGAAVGMGFLGVQMVANVVMFVPIGALLTVALGARWWWVAALVCVALTVGIESTQQSIPGRVSGERDVLTNAVGGLLGALLVVIGTVAARRRDTGAPTAAMAARPATAIWSPIDPGVRRAIGRSLSRPLAVTVARLGRRPGVAPPLEQPAVAPPPLL